MGTIPTPPTFAVGDTSTVPTNLNLLRDAINFWGNTPKCYAYSTGTTLATSGTAGLIPLQAEKYDVVMSGDSPGHDLVTNNSRIVAQTAGKYEIVGQITFASSATGDRQVNIRINSAGAVASGTLVVLARMTSTAAGALPLPTPPVTIDLAAGDYVEMFGLQSSGASLGVTGTDAANTWLQVRLVGS